MAEEFLKEEIRLQLAGHIAFNLRVSDALVGQIHHGDRVIHCILILHMRGLGTVDRLLKLSRFGCQEVHMVFDPRESILKR